MKKTADPIDRHVGARIRLRRLDLGVSQEQLGSRLGLTFQQVQKYERGLSRVGAGRLYRIARVLGVPVGWFFEGLPDPSLDSGLPPPPSARSEAPLAEFLASADGHALGEAFASISDRSTRRRLVELVRTIAETERSRDSLAS